MKTRAFYVASILAVLALCLGFSLLESRSGPLRTHQHRTAPAAPAQPAAQGAFCTHLPILCLDTSGQKVPGSPIGREGQLIIVDTAPDGSASITGALRLIDGGEGENTPADAPILTASAALSYRGNSSRYFDKKSYSIKLVDEAGRDAPQPLCGMEPHHEWILNGPFLDRSLLRNYLCMNIAGQIMEFAPDVRYCELFVDGEYQGLYLLMETISKGEGRIPLQTPERSSDVTGYIIRWDRVGKGDHELRNYTRYTFQAGVSALDVAYPGKNQITPGRMAYIEEDVSRMERALYSGHRTDPDAGGAAHLDYDSLAEYFIINEFFGNVDAGRFSTYYYKAARGKLKACVWDFNNACDNYLDYPQAVSGFTLQNAPWFSMLLRDEAFVDKVVDKYRLLRRGALSDAYLQSYIDETLAFLGDAPSRNFEKWGYVFDLANFNDIHYLQPIERNHTSHEAAVAQLRGYLAARGAWLDAHIHVLYQHCHPSRVH